MAEENTSQENTEEVNDSSESQDQQSHEKEIQDKLYPEKSEDSDDSKDSESDSDSSDDDKSDQADEDSDDEQSDDDQDESDKKSDDSDSDDEDGDSDEDLSVEKPEGSKLSQANIDKIVAYAKEQGLNKDAAQKLVDQQHEALESFVENLQSEHQRQVKEWETVVKSDQELGGEHFKMNMEHAKRAFDRFASDDLKNILSESGYGNHPELVRAFTRIGKAMDDDAILKGDQTSSKPKSMEQIFYGN